MLLHVHVKPGAQKDSLAKTDDGIWKIHIHAQPVDGKANKYLIEYLNNCLSIAKSKIEIKKGETNAHKTMQIDAEESEVIERLNGCS